MEAVQVIETVYERALRDYSFVFREVARQTPVLTDRVAAAQKHLEYINAALADSKKHEIFHNDEIDKLNTELTRLKQETVAVTTYENSLDDKLQTAQTKIDELLAQNRDLVAQLAARQREALFKGETAPTTAAAAK
jgi:chromosome segregation ATPase